MSRGEVVRDSERRSSSSSCETLSGENVVVSAPSSYLKNNNNSDKRNNGDDAFDAFNRRSQQSSHQQQLHPGYPLDTPTISPESPVVSPGKSSSAAAASKLQQRHKSQKTSPSKDGLSAKDMTARLSSSTPSSPAINTKGWSRGD